MSVKKLSILLIGGVVFSVLIYAGFLVYLAWPIESVSINNSGVFGDSFGLLTSLFSGLAFAGLIITIIMQRDELALQRQELALTRNELKGHKKEMRAQNQTLRLQQFENTFFNMLELLDVCRNDIRHNRVVEIVHGRAAIQSIYEIFSRKYLSSDDSLETIGAKAISEDYCKFYTDYGDDIGQYYRVLYNLLKFVDRADVVSNKTVYTNLIRAQLSRYELLLLFYNCVSAFGCMKMTPLVKEYNILKHLEVLHLPEGVQDIWDDFNKLG